MANRITTLFDLDSKGFDSGLKKLRTEVAKADGPINKLKAAGSGLGSILQANVASAAVGAGAALVTFGVKSVKAFQDTALAAGKFADATGTSTEAASRLIEVSSDLGIESGSVQSAIQKMNMAIAKGGPTIDQFGDSIVRAKDGTVDSAASFQNLVTKIGAIEDPTRRALAAQQVFGKGYADIAQMMEMSAGSLAARLADVSDQKVIDDAERRKAEKFRDSMDALRDRMDDVMLAIGEGVVPALTEMGDALADVDEGLQSVFGKGRGIGELIRSAYESSGLATLVNGIRAIGDGFRYLSGGAEEAAIDIKYGTEAAGEMAAMYAERIPPAVEKSNVAVFRLRNATDDAKAAAQELESQWSTLFGTLDDEKALLNLQGQFDELYQAGVDAYAAGVQGSDNAAEAQKRHKQAIVDTKIEVAKYGQEVLGLSPEKVTRILADIDAGSLDRVRNQLDILSRNRTMSLSIIAKGGAGWMVPIDGKKAAGGPVDAGKTYLVGEQGQELFVPKQSGTIIPNNQLNGMTTGATAASAAPMVVNITTGADPESVVQAIERYRRRNGSLPF